MSMKASIPQGMAQIDDTRALFHVFGQITTSGSYVVNGDALDLSQLDAYGGGVPSLAPPLSVRIWEQGAPNSGWQYEFVPGTTLNVTTGTVGELVSTLRVTSALAEAAGEP